jgi:hypothetical protein
MKVSAIENAASETRPCGYVILLWARADVKGKILGFLGYF